MGHHALVGWLLKAAIKQEQHPYHGKNTPEWVAGPPQFRQHAAALTEKEEAAKHKDTQATKERDLEHAGWYYFRVRSHSDNEASPWSPPCDIIVG